MERQMFRRTLDTLRENNLLLQCQVEVDPIFELGAVLNYFENEQPIEFKKPKGYNMPVVGGVFGEREIYYKLLGVEKENRLQYIIHGIANPSEPKRLSKGPVQEVEVSRNVDLLKMFPIPTSNGKDSGPFITAGMLIVKDPQTKDIHMAVRRFQINERDEMNALISGGSPKMLEQLAEYEKKNEPMECAVVLGYDAEFLLASQISSERYGLDKYHVDSALRGEPLELVKCKSVDLEVPAYAEMVLEGHLIPNKRVEEGPFGELMGYYGEVAPQPVMKVTRITHRKDPYFQHAYPSREEHLANGLIREAEIYSYVNTLVETKDVHVTVGGGCRLHAVIQIKKKTEGDPKTAIMAALASSKDIKHVLIVDEDVDIYNYKDIEFVLSSRVQASKDLLVIPDALGSGLEASHVDKGTTDKVGIDGTKPINKRKEYYERAYIPGYEKINIRDYFPDHF